MDASSVTENSLMSGKDGGRQMANLVYLLYLVGFILFPVAIVGFVFAYTNLKYAEAPYKSHLVYQKNLFLKGLIFQAIIHVCNLMIMGLSFITLGIGSFAYILPIGIGIWWFVWTLIRIVQGMQALGRGDKI